MTLEQLEYFRMRARIERSLAENAGQTIAGAIHKELADRYEAAIERTQHRPIISIVNISRLKVGALLSARILKFSRLDRA